MTAHPSPSAFDDAASEVGPGAYYVVRHERSDEYLWTGANARAAHAALARVFAKMGVQALDVPGMGVMVDR